MATLRAFNLWCLGPKSGPCGLFLQEFGGVRARGSRIERKGLGFRGWGLGKVVSVWELMGFRWRAWG